MTQDLSAAAQEKRRDHLASRPWRQRSCSRQPRVQQHQFTTFWHSLTAKQSGSSADLRTNQPHTTNQQHHTAMEAPQFHIDYMDDSDSQLVRGIWSEEEHERFLEAMKMYPLGPWRTIADHVRTRSIKQVQTHAQKYQQKVARRQRGLRKQKKRVARPEHRVDQAAAGYIVRKAIEQSTEAPGSPTSFEELLFQATPPVPEQHVRLEVELDTIEPLPFSYCSSADPLGYATEVHHKDLEESLMLFLASV